MLQPRSASEAHRNAPPKESGTYRINGWSALQLGYCRVERIDPRQSLLSFSFIRHQPSPERWNLADETLRLLAEGASSSGVASELGVSEATVSRHLATVLAEVGCTRASVPLIARVLGQLPAPTQAPLRADVRVAGPVSWSSSEQEVSLLSLQGLTLGEIARKRRASIATVRSQLRAASRKAGSCDRYELGASPHIVIHCLRANDAIRQIDAPIRLPITPMS